MVKSFNRRGLLLASVASVSMISSAALAQEDEEANTNQSPAAETVQETVEETENQQPEPTATPQDTIVVTGSRLRRDEFTATSPITVINAEEATLEGLVDTADIIQGSTIAAGSVQFNNQFGGFVVEGGTGINSISLRGLGANRSLVLLNGRRPGPAGVRGQVGSFDLNVIPDSIIQRVEILKDGASSVYGSDAVAGVVNIITLTSVDRPTLTAQYNQPFAGGGESYSIDGAYGLNFDRGSIALAAQYEMNEDLSLGDRDYFKCGQDNYFDPQTGERIDREDRSILAGTQFGGCNAGPIYFNTVIPLNLGIGSPFVGERFIPSPDGRTIGPIPGYRPRENGRYDDGDGIPAFYEDVINDERALEDDVLNQTERFSFYANSNFDFDFLGGANWQNEFLFTRRETRSEGTRQFFPLVSNSALFAPGGAFGPGGVPAYTYANDPDYSAPFDLSQPIMIYPSDSEALVDYYSFSTQLDGDFGAGGYFSDWGYSLIGTYSRSEGEYTNKNQIFADQSGDILYDDDAPVFDYFSPAFLSGNYPDNFYETLGGDITGNTTYEQWVATGFVNGDLFELPAGDVMVALGGEYRDYSINDVPAEQAQAGNLWGFSSAQVTKGSDSVVEGFGEIEVPILAGKPFVEELNFNASGRIFEYDSTGSGEVWKLGANWQIVPSLRLRGTIGTSYRSPALYELFLGNQTSFLAQLNIDPCIDYQNSTNENIRQNCAAAGIPADYAGGGSSATIISGGGAGVLTPETSDAETLGVIFTPDFMPLSLAVDYFEITVNDQIDRLGANAIVTSCYNADNFPNQFCTLFTRGTPSSEFAISEVRDSFLNINEQSTRGIDVVTRYEQDFDFGTILVDANATYTLEDVVQLFDPSLVSGFEENDFNGTIGDPRIVANADFRFERGDWTYSWFTEFIGHQSNKPFADAQTTYFGRDAVQIIDTEATWYHGTSVRWEGDLTTITAGISNLFDEDPPIISSGANANRRGNVPAFAGYDFRGRTGFIRASRRF